MTDKAVRLTIVMTHPVQYTSPWFRYIASSCPEIDLTVLYGAIPAADQQGVGFGQAFTWDVPLSEGYRMAVCADAAGKSFSSDNFFGIDVTDLEQRLLATSPDVVLIPGWHSAMQMRALRACRRHGIPVLYRGDSTLVSGPGGAVRLLWEAKTRYMLRQFDGYLAVGTHADTYLRRFGAPDPLIARSPHAVDNTRFAREADRHRAEDRRAQLRGDIGASDNDLVVLFAGKFQPIKRPLDAVHAVARLGTSAVLMTAGDGPLAAETRAAAERLGVRIASRGFLNQSQLPEAFAAADAVLVPSERETWGMVVNEALASGLPCVVTNTVGCAPDLIAEGVTGYVVGTGDIDAMSDRLDAIRAARASGHDFAAACRRQVQSCSFEASTEGLRLLCRRVVRRRPSVPQSVPVRVVACCGGMVSVFGTERMTFEVLRALRQKGAAVHCLFNSWGSSRIVPLAEDIGASWSPGRYMAPLRRRGLTPALAARIAWDVLRTSAALWRDARRLRATHVFAPDFSTVLRNLPALALLRMRGATVVLKVGNAPDSSPFYDRLWHWIIAPFVNVAVANSQFTAAALKTVGVPVRKVRVIPHTAPTRQSQNDATPVAARRVIYIGQLIPQKGADVLLEAVALLVGRGVDATLDVVGDIDGWESPAWAGYHARLRGRADKPDLAGRIRFLGHREDVASLLAASAVHCVPSRREIREAFGVVVVEAKEAGIPSVVTPSGGLPELIQHRSDGWVAIDDTADALAEGLEYFLVDDRRRVQAAAAAKESAARFSAAIFARAWLDIFGLSQVQTPPVTVAAVERHAH
jgi:glycosyltransferase involved in cell wall biosynthesis